MRTYLSVKPGLLCLINQKIQNTSKTFLRRKVISVKDSRVKIVAGMSSKNKRSFCEKVHFVTCKLGLNVNNRQRPIHASENLSKPKAMFTLLN